MSKFSMMHLRLKEEGFVCDLFDLEKMRATREIPQMSEGLKSGSPSPSHSSPEAQPPTSTCNFINSKRMRQAFQHCFHSFPRRPPSLQLTGFLLTDSLTPKHIRLQIPALPLDNQIILAGLTFLNLICQMLIYVIVLLSRRSVKIYTKCLTNPTVLNKC